MKIHMFKLLNYFSLSFGEEINMKKNFPFARSQIHGSRSFKPLGKVLHVDVDLRSLQSFRFLNISYIAYFCIL